jgi:hypothetical protein
METPARKQSFAHEVLEVLPSALMGLTLLGFLLFWIGKQIVNVVARAIQHPSLETIYLPFSFWVSLAGVLLVMRGIYVKRWSPVITGLVVLGLYGGVHYLLRWLGVP